MATVNFIPESNQSISAMKAVIDYCLQQKKVADEDSGRRLVGGVNCNGENSFTEFMVTKNAHKKKGGITFYHYVQSFSPKENISAEQVHKIGLEFAEKAWPGHEVLVTTHTDAEHLHNHFVINSVHYENGNKLRQNPGTLNRLRTLSDSICNEHGLNIVYVDDNSTIKVNTDNGFSDITGGIIIVDTANFGGLYYLDSLNNRSLFFSLDSRAEFSALLTKYDLAQLVVAGTLLTPYLTQLESVTFVLKTLMMFAIVFVVSLVFILYISNYVDIFVNRKRYALKETLGFSHFKILKNRYLIWAIEIMVSAILVVINVNFACLFGIILLDYLFCELLYQTYIKKVLYEIEKGA